MSPETRDAVLAERRACMQEALTGAHTDHEAILARPEPVVTAAPDAPVLSAEPPPGYVRVWGWVTVWSDGKWAFSGSPPDKWTAGKTTRIIADVPLPAEPATVVGKVTP